MLHMVNRALPLLIVMTVIVPSPMSIFVECVILDNREGMDSSCKILAGYCSGLDEVYLREREAYNRRSILAKDSETGADIGVQEVQAVVEAPFSDLVIRP